MENKNNFCFIVFALISLMLVSCRMFEQPHDWELTKKEKKWNKNAEFKSSYKISICKGTVYQGIIDNESKTCDFYIYKNNDTLDLISNLDCHSFVKRYGSSFAKITEDPDFFKYLMFSFFKNDFDCGTLYYDIKKDTVLDYEP